MYKGVLIICEAICVLQGIDTPTPKVVLPNGSELLGSYQQSMGSHLIFTTTEENVQLEAKTGTILKLSSKPSS